MSDTERYQEDPDFVPNPADYTGTLDTSGTAGAAHGKIEAVTPIFDIAKHQDLQTAAKALDPDDDTVSESSVVLPTPVITTQAGGDADAARERILAKADASEEPDLYEKNAFEKEAGESTDEDKAPRSVGGEGGIAREGRSSGDGGALGYGSASVDPDAPATTTTSDTSKSTTTSDTSGDYDPTDHSVSEVNDYLAANPDKKDAVLAKERSGKNRSTIVNA